MCSCKVFQSNWTVRWNLNHTENEMIIITKNSLQSIQYSLEFCLMRKLLFLDRSPSHSLEHSTVWAHAACTFYQRVISYFLFWCSTLLSHFTSIVLHFWVAFAVWKAIQPNEAPKYRFLLSPWLFYFVDHILCPHQAITVHISIIISLLWDCLKRQGNY